MHDICIALIHMHAFLQVSNSKSIARAVAAALPRQALALTLAHWELATKTSCMLGCLSPTMHSNGVEAPIDPAAGSLLLLSSLVSKASCSVQQPLPDQAMDAWQHALWPTGDTELLCMGMVLAADPALQSFAIKLGAQQDSSQSQSAGKLQQSVIAAATLLSELAMCVSDALTPTTVGEDGTGGESPRSGQSQGLHPAVVSALAVRIFQLSNGNPTAAMAFLVASVLPEWELDLPPRAQPAEAGLVYQGSFGLADGQVPNSDGDLSPSVLANRARQRFYRKRARSPSRSVTNGVTPMTVLCPSSLKFQPHPCPGHLLHEPMLAFDPTLVALQQDFPVCVCPPVQPACLHMCECRFQRIAWLTQASTPRLTPPMWCHLSRHLSAYLGSTRRHGSFGSLQLPISLSD